MAPFFQVHCNSWFLLPLSITQCTVWQSCKIAHTYTRNWVLQWISETFYALLLCNGYDLPTTNFVCLHKGKLFSNICIGQQIWFKKLIFYAFFKNKVSLYVCVIYQMWFNTLNFLHHLKNKLLFLLHVNFLSSTKPFSLNLLCYLTYNFGIWCGNVVIWQLLHTSKFDIQGFYYIHMMLP
jgi:hypothetical protein